LFSLRVPSDDNGKGTRKSNQLKVNTGPGYVNVEQAMSLAAESAEDNKLVPLKKTM